MRDIKIYLHTNTTPLQSLVHLLAASCFFLKASQLRLNVPYYLIWLYFNISFGVLFSLAALFQAGTRFTFLYLAVTLNILAGVVLIVETLVKLTVVENLVKFTLTTVLYYLLHLSAGFILVLVGIYEGRIRKIPYIVFNKRQVYGRQSWFSSFAFSWQDITAIHFRYNRVKITTRDGAVYRYRVAKQSAGGIMFNSAEYFCRQTLGAHQPSNSHAGAVT
jgi:hypothetical protein